MKYDEDLVDEIVKTGVLVIGGGLAGCMAAIEAHENFVQVVIAVEGKVGKSGCTPLAGGLGGADFMVDSASISKILSLENLGPEKPNLKDNPEEFKKDILEDGEYLNNPRLVDVYVNESPNRMKRLIDLGLRITKITSAHGVRFPRGVIALNTDISATLIKNIQNRHIKILEDTKIIDLLTRDGICVGAIGVMIKSGKIVVVESNAVIIATGGWQMAYITGGTDELTGDGQAMAFRAGAKLVDMEFSTFMDRYLIWPPIASRDNFIWNWNISRELVNNQRTDILSDVPHDFRRSLSAKLVSKEVSEGRGSEHGGVYLNNPDETIRNGYINMGDILEEGYNENLKFEVGVGCHYFNGGIKINEKCETSVQGLYAAGEVSGGLFGARRIASALSEALIQGSISGEMASKYILSANELKPDPEHVYNISKKMLSPMKRSEGIKPLDIFSKIRKITLESLSLYRNKEGLQRALKEIAKIRKVDILRLYVSGTKSRKFNKEWVDCLSLESLLLCLEASTRAAILREESRGYHIRSDFPLTSDDWLKNIVISKYNDEMVTNFEPIIMQKGSH